MEDNNNTRFDSGEFSKINSQIEDIRKILVDNRDNRVVIEELSKIRWQIQGIRKMLVDNRVVIEQAKRVLIELESELRKYTPSPLNPGDSYKELYYIIKKDIDSLQNYLNHSRNTQYRGLGYILQMAGLPITDQGIETLLRGEPIKPRQDATIKLNEVSVLSQALGIKLRLLNDSFKFKRSKAGILRPGNLPNRAANAQAPNWMKRMDETYGTFAVYIWDNGYQSQPKLKELEKGYLEEVLKSKIQ